MKCCLLPLAGVFAQSKREEKPSEYDAQHQQMIAPSKSHTDEYKNHSILEQSQGESRCYSQLYIIQIVPVFFGIVLLLLTAVLARPNQGLVNG